MSAAWDIVIVGGGLSGLALAAELSQPVFTKLRILVLEARTDYVRDRTWSYWRSESQPAHAYAHLERARWNRWRVGQGDRLATQQHSTTHYCTLDADAFYQEALRKVRACQHIELRLGAPVKAVVDGVTPTVRTSSLEAISASWICDARPPAPKHGASLVQQFAGWEVRTQQDVFDVNTVDLMRFETCEQGLHFFYVLPYSARGALIESTWVSAANVKPDYEAELQHYTQQILGKQNFEITYREKGVLPLQSVPRKLGQRVLPIGSNAGTLRPSTGYAFIDTLQHTQQLTKSLLQSLGQNPNGDALQNWQPPQFARPAIDLWMDRVFLDVLQNDWSRAPEFFLQMFEHVDTANLLAFLTGNATLAQRMAVARVLPKSPFLSAAMRQFFKP